MMFAEQAIELAAAQTCESDDRAVDRNLELPDIIRLGQPGRTKRVPRRRQAGRREPVAQPAVLRLDPS